MKQLPRSYEELPRRHFLAGMAGLAGLGLAGGLTARLARVVDTAYRSDPAGTGSLADIDHFVLLMQENRSFDHYFGSMSGVLGFDDLGPDAAQRGYRVGDGPDPSGRLWPYPLNPQHRDDNDVLNDPAHDWTVQHAAWNRGAMDAWITSHLATDGPVYAPEVMSYFTRADLPTHYALADAFTVCDRYFCSVLGPTAPNRMYWMTGTLDPDGSGGGPVIAGSAGIPHGSLRWQTFPETLLDAGVSWKVYNAHAAAVNSELSGMLKYFHAYRDPTSELYQRGVAPRLDEFRADVAGGTLPSVSWVIPAQRDSEHASYPPAAGAECIMRVLDILTANPAVWERTALIVSYDENGGFYDHVPPPTPPVGTIGEFIDAGRLKFAADAPIGLGFRVPSLVISPYSRGGRVFSETSDHTSQLKLIGRRFGVPVPNLTVWRDATVGDLSGAFQARPRGGGVPASAQARAAADEVASEQDEIALANAGHAPAPRLSVTAPPRQERLPLRTRIGVA